MSIITKGNTGVFSKDGQEIVKYTLKDEFSNDYVEVLNIGCALYRIVAHNRNGEAIDVCCAHAGYEDYIEEKASIFGTVIGRCANRISNARFSINGVEYKVAANEGKNSLHGGIKGYNSKFWNAEIVDGTLVMTYRSVDGEEGYPGNADNTVIYAFDNHRLSIKYDAVSDKDTVFNFTNHCFFNVNGHGNGTVLTQQLKLYSDKYCPVDDELLLSGEKRDLAGTPFDFREFKEIGKDIYADDPMLNHAHGYDLAFALDGPKDELRLAAELRGEKSGILMKTYTTLPAIQLYTGMLLGGIPAYTTGKDGVVYESLGALCLETEEYPDSINIAQFPDVVSRAGAHYCSETVYEFVAE